VGATQDVTEIRRVQDETFAMQKLETLGTLANGIAHDFNNLLGGTVAQAELALAELKAGAVPEKEMETIRDVALHGSEIVRELMIYAGTESPDLVPLDISQAVEEIMGLLQISIAKHVTLETDLGRDLPAVRANPARISQLVLNLVTNASEALQGRQGTIRIVTRHVRRGDGSRAITPLDRDCLQLAVSDTGCGMTAEMKAKVFDPFFSTKSRGRGLGLAVVSGIVRSLGGAILLSSEAGKGTTFEILLPSAETASAAPPHPRAGVAKVPLPSQTATVLVVEDEHPLRQAVARMLRRRGFSVIEAEDGTVGLQAIRARQTPIDLALLDITLAGAPSSEVLREARQLRPEMPVIATSAYTQERATALLGGEPERFLRKPYRIEELAQVMQEVL
jgi:nitrogen-specific signal transduction histidine kinase